MGFFLFLFKEMQTQEDVSIEDAVKGSNETDCDEATDEEPMDKEAYESPYDTEDETTTETETSEDDGGDVPNKSERLGILVIKITACEPYTMTQFISQRVKQKKTLIFMNPNPETIPVVQ